jgi:hypothetical protein
MAEFRVTPRCEKRCPVLLAWQRLSDTPIEAFRGAVRHLSANGRIIRCPCLTADRRLTVDYLPSGITTSPGFIPAGQLPKYLPSMTITVAVSFAFKSISM